MPSDQLYADALRELTVRDEHIDTLTAERDRLAAELQSIDNVLARRPALGHLDSRRDKIEYALTTCSRADRVVAENKALRDEVERRKVQVRAHQEIAEDALRQVGGDPEGLTYFGVVQELSAHGVQERANYNAERQRADAAEKKLATTQEKLKAFDKICTAWNLPRDLMEHERGYWAEVCAKNIQASADKEIALTERAQAAETQIAELKKEIDTANIAVAELVSELPGGTVTSGVHKAMELGRKVRGKLQKNIDRRDAVIEGMRESHAKLRLEWCETQEKLEAAEARVAELEGALECRTTEIRWLARHESHLTQDPERVAKLRRDIIDACDRARAALTPPQQETDDE